MATYFHVEISDIHLQLHTGEEALPGEELQLCFDFTDFKSLSTTWLKYPWKWQEKLPSFIFNTKYPTALHEQSLSVRCLRPGRLCRCLSADACMGQARVDLRTIVSGPSEIELRLVEPHSNHTFAMVHFHVNMNEVVRKLSFTLSNIDLTELYHALTPFLVEQEQLVQRGDERAEDTFIQLGYRDPSFTSWHLEVLPITISSLRPRKQDDNGAQAVLVPDMSISIKDILATQFLRSSLYFVVWSASKRDRAAGRYRQHCRILIPTLGNYDSHNSAPRRISARVLWRAADKSEMNETSVTMQLAIKNGPRYAQLLLGKLSRQLTITGYSFIGMPMPMSNIPNFRHVYRIATQQVNISKLIYAYCMNLKEMRQHGYIYVPPWFVCQQPSKELLDRYPYVLSEKDILSNEHLCRLADATASGDNSNAEVTPPVTVNIGNTGPLVQQQYPLPSVRDLQFVYQSDESIRTSVSLQNPLTPSSTHQRAPLSPIAARSQPSRDDAGMQLTLLRAILKHYRREIVKREQMSDEDRKRTRSDHERAIVWLQYRCRAALDALYA